MGSDNFRNGQFSIIQQKTGNRCVLDINVLTIESRVVWEILERYGYCDPYSGDINDFNSYLHELLYHIGEEFLKKVHVDNKLSCRRVNLNISSSPLIPSDDLLPLLISSEISPEVKS